MTTVVTISSKGSPLTYSEIDANFNNLNRDKIERTLTASDSLPALKITQAGTGPCLIVNDSVGDTTPFIIDANGNITSSGTARIGDNLFNANSIELNNYASVDSGSWIDFHSSATFSDYNSRIVRQQGVDGSLDIIQTGAGPINITGNINFSGNITNTGSITSSGSIFAPGALIQVVGKTISTQSSQTVAASAVDTQVGTGSDFILSITPKRTGSYIKITVRMFAESDGGWELVYNIQRDGVRVNTINNLKYHGLSMSCVTYGQAADDHSTPDILNIQTLDKSGVTAGVPVSYKLVVSSSNAGTQALFVNRCIDSAGGAGLETGISEIILEEIAQ